MPSLTPDRTRRELHDRVGQSLSALNINLDLISRESHILPAAMRQRLADSLGLVDGTLQSIENVMADLRPPLLEEYGLGAALGWHAEEFSRRTGVQVTVADPDPPLILHDEEVHQSSSSILMILPVEALVLTSRTRPPGLSRLTS